MLKLSYHVLITASHLNVFLPIFFLSVRNFLKTLLPKFMLISDFLLKQYRPGLDILFMNLILDFMDVILILYN